MRRPHHFAAGPGAAGPKVAAIPLPAAGPDLAAREPHLPGIKRRPVEDVQQVALPIVDRRDHGFEPASTGGTAEDLLPRGSVEQEQAGFRVLRRDVASGNGVHAMKRVVPRP